MNFETRTFATADDLVALARADVRRGLWRTLNPAEEEPCLLWLDRLAAQRSDWHGPIGQALGVVALEGRDGAQAVVDWYERAQTGPKFAEVAACLAESGVPDLAPAAQRATERWQQLQRKPLTLLVHQPKVQLLTLASAGDLLDAATQASHDREPRLGPGALGGGWYCLDFLRFAAFFAAWVAEAEGTVLAGLQRDDPDGLRAVVEYCAHAGDKAQRLDLMRELDRVGSPTLDLPYETAARQTRKPRDLLAEAIAVAEEELRTRPLSP